jgi:ABC-type methionine transport system ATPase subunit
MAPLLSLTDVHKSYLHGRHRVLVLTEISLDVYAGDILAIWGQRRAGKTTLARIAAGLEAPDQGTVSFDGQNLATGRDRASHLREVAWVQCARLRNDVGTVLECVALPLLLSDHSRREAQRRARSMLEQLELMDYAGERLEDLPDGQHTLVSMASALVREPRLLIADDLSLDLDLAQHEQVTGILRQLADEKGLGVLITIDEMVAAQRTNRIGALSHGTLIMPGESPSDRGILIEFPSKRQSA